MNLAYVKRKALRISKGGTFGKRVQLESEEQNTSIRRAIRPTTATLSTYTQTLPHAHTAVVARVGAQLFTDCSQSRGEGTDRRGLTH